MGASIGPPNYIERCEFLISEKKIPKIWTRNFSDEIFRGQFLRKFWTKFLEGRKSGHLLERRWMKEDLEGRFFGRKSGNLLEGMKSGREIFFWVRFFGVSSSRENFLSGQLAQEIDESAPGCNSRPRFFTPRVSWLARKTRASLASRIPQSIVSY